MRFQQFLNEGTWTAPQTYKKALELETLFQKPLKLKDSTDLLYNLIGCDKFYNKLDQLKRQHPNDLSMDVRQITANWIKKNWLDLIPVGQTNNKENSWKENWDLKALEILRKLSTEVY